MSASLAVWLFSPLICFLISELFGFPAASPYYGDVFALIFVLEDLQRFKHISKRVVVQSILQGTFELRVEDLFVVGLPGPRSFHLLVRVDQCGLADERCMIDGIFYGRPP